jgi:hypothetical protein
LHSGKSEYGHKNRHFDRIHKIKAHFFIAAYPPATEAIAGSFPFRTTEIRRHPGTFGIGNRLCTEDFSSEN